MAQWESEQLEIEGSLPHMRHCVVSLSKTVYPLLCTGSIQENVWTLDMTENLLTGK